MPVSPAHISYYVLVAPCGRYDGKRGDDDEDYVEDAFNRGIERRIENVVQREALNALDDEQRPEDDVHDSHISVEPRIVFLTRPQTEQLHDLHEDGLLDGYGSEDDCRDGEGHYKIGQHGGTVLSARCRAVIVHRQKGRFLGNQGDKKTLKAYLNLPCILHR